MLRLEGRPADVSEADLTTSPKRMRSIVFLSLFAASGLVLSACDAFDSSGSGRANLTVRMTDAPFPFDLAAEANVSITKIELLASGDDEAEDDSTVAARESADRIVLFDAAVEGGPFDLNLLDLRDGVDTTLVSSLSIPADGSYRQLRFYVGDDASVVFTDGREFRLKLPSAQQSGIKVMLPAFEADGEDVDVLIDFDVEKSFVVRGDLDAENFQGFLFKPVLEVETFDVRDGESDGESDGDSGEEGSDDESDGDTSEV